MKKLVMSIATAILALTLMACGTKSEKPPMYIEKAQLTEKEEAMAELLDSGDRKLIYDFKLDDSVESLQVSTYKLLDGRWEEVLGSRQVFSDKEGRLALDFEDMAQGVRIALQSENDSGSSSYLTKAGEGLTGMSRASAMLNELTEITYEQEIPLAVQVSTTQDSISSYNVEYFFKPEEYAKHGYEQVYAITISFSSQMVGEKETQVSSE